MERMIANTLYETAKYMDFADYEEQKEEEINLLVEELKRLDHKSVLWNCLESICVPE